MSAHAFREEQRASEATPPLAALPRPSSPIFDIPIDLAAPPDLLRTVSSWATHRRTRRVMYVNAHVVNQSHVTDGLAEALGRADLVYCDGYGVRLAARAMHLEVPHRMTGADWIWTLAALCERSAVSIYLLGSEPPIARQAAARLARWYPGLQIVGAHHGFFGLESPHNERVIEDIVEARPRIVLVGMGTPKQELWVDRYADRLGGAVVWTVGALFDYVSGHTPRAPRWLADNGLEWIFRLAIEPHRMWRRYLIGNPVFLSRVMAESRHHAASPALDPLTDRFSAGRLEALAAIVVTVLLLALTWHFNAKPRHEIFSAAPDTLRALAATVVVFAIGGFGLVRLLLPAALREYELLWVLPTGGCAVGLALTLLGFAYVPYAVALGLVLVVGAGFGAYAVRRRGWPGLPRRVAWPGFVALAVTFVALVPMLLAQHYAAPIGTGSDAHVAAGTANFLQHAYPTGTDISQPINQMPPTWQSKYPIYYAFAAVSSVSGLATWQVLAILAAAMLGLAALGFFLVAREVFCAPAAVAVVAMALAALDREALHTILNPYFNQTWGFFAMPFTLVLGWWVVQPGLGRRARSGTAALLAVFGLVLVFAYPLAAPIPAVPLVVFMWREWRRKLRAGEPTFRFRDLYRGRGSLVWLIPLAVLLTVPAIGVGQKVVGAAKVLAPGNSLQAWAGDLPGFIPFNYFLSLPSPLLFVPVVVGVFALAAYCLWRAPRSLTWGLGGLLAIGVLLAVYLRHRQYGWYFHFKLLAFIGPLVMVMAAVGAARLRRFGAVALALLAVATGGSAVAELAATGSQLPQTTIQLASWARSLPRGASVRLDMWAPLQLWAAYMMDSRPLCSELPLLDTDYPHVATSRKADYIVATLVAGRPFDAIGPVLRQNLGYRLYRENPAVPGPSFCTLRRYDRIYTAIGWSPQ